MKRPERLRIFRLDPDVAVTLLNAAHNFEFLQLPISDECPDGTEVLEIWVNQHCRCLEFLATHPSFELWVPGTEVCRSSSILEVKAFRRKQISELFEPAGVIELKESEESGVGSSGS